MVRRFSAQQPVRWLSPTEILRGASGEFFGGLFGKYADNRDRQDLARAEEVYRHPSVTLDVGDSGLTCRLIDGEPDNPPAGAAKEDEEDDEEPPADYVVDYVADIGDGFGATYAIAELMARKELHVEGQVTVDGRTIQIDDPTRRGSLLVMGGDQVYPVANEVDYDNRTVGPYVLAYDDLGENEVLPVYAIPGNHDWYDGLASFLQIFTNNDGIYRDQSSLLSVQSRSYFAVALPNGWWLWGIDTGLSPDARLDLAQTQYFRKVAKLMKDRDRVILATAEPFWIKRRRGTDDVVRAKDDWDYLVDFLSRTLTPDGNDDWKQVTKSKNQMDEQAWLGRIRLILSGDKHFYVRHQPATPDLPVLISSGGGGAYTSSTWEVGESVALNGEPVKVGGTTSDVATNLYRAEKVWPSRRTSLVRGMLGLVTLPPRNPRMAAVVGGIYALFTYAFVTGQIQPTLRPGEGAGRLNVALERFDGHCAGDLDTIATMDCVKTLSVDLTQGTLNSFVSAVVATFILAALYLFASAGWNERLNDPWSRLAATLGAAAFHTVLHAAALGITVVTSVAMVIQLPSDQPVRFERVWIPLAIVSVTAMIPVLWRWWRHKVRDLDGLSVLFIPTFLLVVLHWLGSSDDLVTAAVAVVLAAGIIGGALGTFVLTLYMVASQFVAVHLNELFVGLRSEDHKQFLRLRMTEKELTVYSIGYRSVKPRTVTWDGNEPTVVRPIGEEKHCLVDSVTIPREV